MDQELVQYLEGRFERQEQRFDARFEDVNARLDERIEEVKRHTGVLVEGLCHEIQLVAEGLVLHIEVRHREDREYFDRKFEDTHTIIRSSYDHLQQQHEQLRQRVETLERKGQA
jgi:hypothetical protein